MWLPDSPHPDKLAIRSQGNEYSYSELHQASDQVASSLMSQCHDFKGKQVALMLQPSFKFLASLIGIWKAGAMAVPLALKYPEEELSYIVSNSCSDIMIADDLHLDRLKRISQHLGVHLLPFDSLIQNDNESSYLEFPGEHALMLYTSGTTNKPKGVVITHTNLDFQTHCLSNAWQWNSDDHILNVLPLHHVHGLVNVVLTALKNQATITFHSSFEAEKIWEAFQKESLTLFMAVPTIYSKLIEHFDSANEEEKVGMRESGSNFRLMVSGSAALPVSVLEKWQSITGQRLLERYGMTEIGMALSNPYNEERRAGTVGQPLPGIEVKLLDEKFEEKAASEKGEIWVKGPNVFTGYWQEPGKTEESFRDGWFRTGDMAVIEDGYYKILGRSSVDIIKSGGYKISALEIEEVLRQHPAISDCAVVGIPDETWGETIHAAIISNAENLEPKTIAEWLPKKLASYKMPRVFHQLDSLPRNALGKVTKPKLVEMFSKMEHQT